MPFFLKSKAVFTLELKFPILNFSNANPKKFFRPAASKAFKTAPQNILLAF